jgi:hypothetical protein
MYVGLQMQVQLVLIRCCCLSSRRSPAAECPAALYTCALDVIYATQAHKDMQRCTRQARTSHLFSHVLLLMCTLTLLMSAGLPSRAICRLRSTPRARRPSGPPRGPLQPSLPHRRGLPAPAQLPGKDSTRVCGVWRHCAYCKAAIYGAGDRD